MFIIFSIHLKMNDHERSRNINQSKPTSTDTSVRISSKDIKSCYICIPYIQKKIRHGKYNKDPNKTFGVGNYNI